MVLGAAVMFGCAVFIYRKYFRNRLVDCSFSQIMFLLLMLILSYLPTDHWQTVFATQVSIQGNWNFMFDGRHDFILKNC